MWRVFAGNFVFDFKAFFVAVFNEIFDISLTPPDFHKGEHFFG